jgi:hypothetical protein
MRERHPLRVQVSEANVHDSTLAYRLMDGLNLKAVKRFVADKAYDDDKLVWRLKKRNICAEIPPRHSRKVNGIYDKTVYAWRRGIENLFAKRTENRRLALWADAGSDIRRVSRFGVHQMDVCQQSLFQR